MNEIQLTVTVEEANLILEALGLLPFARVYGLVGKLQQQASVQINGDRPSGESAAGDPAAGDPAARAGEVPGGE